MSTISLYIEQPSYAFTDRQTVFIFVRDQKNQYIPIFILGLTERGGGKAKNMRYKQTMLYAIFCGLSEEPVYSCL